MRKILSVAEILIKWTIYGILVIIFLIVAIAIFSDDIQGEANTGSFSSQSFNEGWILERNGSPEKIILPVTVDAKKGDMLTIKNTLPGDLHSGSCLMVRASMEDVYIYINGELREEYSTDNLSVKVYHLPSAYVVTELSEKDSCAELVIQIRVKTKGTLNEIQLGQGNNVWFSIIHNNMAVNVAAFVVLILGLILIISSLIMQFYVQTSRASFFLGLLMLNTGIWIFSESNLRQILFSKPSLTLYFAIISVELIGAIACLFFDEVQHRKYHISYVVIEALVCIQLLVNIILHFTKIAELYQTLVFSHIWMAVGLIVGVVNIISDIRTKIIHQYSTTAIGMVCFLAASLLELVGFYVTRFHVFGIFVCFGLVMLAAATVIQVLIDQNKVSREREKKQTRMVINTIETIAGAIDAKDEYTGGHSERVGHYAAILARGMAADYDFTEEDILRIQYIGNMHDIGKIGVTDSILNKAGRLTDDEFCLMKRHVEIGAELISGIGENIEGLVDGILYHHERFDGRGYPKGLSDTEIPLIARIICLSDCYDAMSSNRVYRKCLSNEEIRAEIVKCSGTQFDPALAEIFVRLMDSGEIVPYTVDGMAAARNGAVLKSALLEDYLQTNAGSVETKAKKPAYIRMLCYIVKMKEKKGERVDIFLLKSLEDSAENREAINVLVKPYLQPEDINIEYNEYKHIVVLFQKTDEKINRFVEALQDSAVKIEVEQMHPCSAQTGTWGADIYVF